MGRRCNNDPPLQFPFPTSLGPEVWRSRIGSETGRGPPVIGSGCIVSPETISTHPRSSTALVKKSPSRRSSPVATHSVPFWHRLLSAIGRPAASAFADVLGVALAAPVSVTVWIRSFAGWQARSTTLSVSYQTTLSLPASPATAHGHSARTFDGDAIACGADQVAPKSFEKDIRTWLGAGVGLPSQPPAVPACEGLVSQIRYSVPAASWVSVGQCAYVEPVYTRCGVNVASPRLHVETPSPSS